MSKFDPAAATQAYLAALPPEAHAKASEYTHGRSEEHTSELQSH